jgi:class 3 adenylate cyclase
MRCAACERENPPGSRFCNGCGARLDAACASCGQVNPADAAFCNACGARVGAAREPAPTDPRAYTPRHLAERILRTRSTLEGERKHVTVLFCDLEGSTPLAERLGPEAMHAAMDRFIRLICEQVHAFEGTVNQFLGDGAMALFGAPLAIEGAPRRALQAALGIRRAIAPLSAELRERHGVDLRLRIGIHSGPVVVGRIGDDLRMDYTAVGDTTHLASRMQGVAAADSILISDATAHLVAGYFELRDRGAVTLKGVAEPVRIHEVVAERAARDRVEARAATGLTPLVGRGRELAVLEDAFASASTGRGRVVFIVGEAGLGKSRLLFEFRQRLANVPHGWIEGRCASYARSTAFHPIVDALRRRIGIDERDDEVAALAKIQAEEEREGGSLAWTLPFVRHLLSLPVGDPAVEGMDAAIRRSETSRALRARLERAAERGAFVFVIEDLHWIDKASEELVEYLTDALPTLRGLVLLTHRPGYTHPFGDRSYHLRLALEPLSGTEMEQMAESVLDTTGMPGELRALIARKAEGNPFFVEEVTRSLQEAGAFRSVGGRVELAHALDELAVPDSIHDVLMARLDRLGDEPKRALQIASVIGREFAVRLLERIHEEGARLAPLLAELRTLELIYEKANHPELAFMFKHALTHDVAYASVLETRRKALHRIVGLAIEELYRDRLAEHYEALAHHFGAGDEPEKAFHYHVRASEKAVDAFANQAAADHCRRALDLADRLGDAVPRDVRRELEERLGHVLHLVSEFTPSGHAYERAAALADDPGFDHANAAYSYTWGHAYERAQASLDAGRANARSRPSQGFLRFVDAFAHAVTGDLDRYEVLVAEGEQLADGHIASLAFGHFLAGQLAEWRGDYRRAAAECRAAAESARKERLTEVLASSLWFESKALCCLGAYAPALANLRESLDLAERIGYRSHQARILNTIGWMHAEIGATSRAAEANGRAEQIARQMVHEGLLPGAPEIHGNAAINLAGNQLALGELGRAAEILAEIRAQVDRETDPWLLWRYRLHLIDAEGCLALARRDPAMALSLAEQELAGARARGLRKLEARALELVARSLAAQDERARAAASIDEAIAIATAIEYPPVIWRAHALAAELAARAGRRDARDRAVAAARASLASAAQDLPEDLLRELRGLGDRLLARAG